eukprot:jgi/Galph1/4951/GphlegSOOS_G3631.1
MGFFLKYPEPGWAQMGWLLLFGTGGLLFFCAVPLFVRLLDWFPALGRRMNKVLSHYSQLDTDFQSLRDTGQGSESQSNQLERNWEGLRAKFTNQIYSRLGLIPDILRVATNIVALSIYIAQSYTGGFQRTLGAIEVAFGIFFGLDYFLRFYLVSLDSTLIGFVFRVESLADFYSVPSLISTNIVFMRQSGIAFVSFINFNYLRAFNLYYSFVRVYYPGGHDPETQKPKQVSALRPFIFCWLLYLFVIIFVSSCTVYSLEMLGEIDNWQIVNSVGAPIWNVFNSIYFVVVTISTVGYGDITPTTYPARVATILLIIFVAFYFASKLSTVLEVVQEQKLGSGQYLKRKGTKHILVIGRHKFADFEHFCAAFYSSPINATTHIVILARMLPWSEEDFSLLQMSKKRDFVHFLRGNAAEARDLQRAKLSDASAVFAFLAGGSSDRFGEDSVQVIRIHAVRALNPTIPIFSILLEKDLHVHVKSCLFFTENVLAPYSAIGNHSVTASESNEAAAVGSVPYESTLSKQDDSVCYSICARELLCCLMSLNVVCDGATTLISNLVFSMKARHVNQNFPWLWEYSHGVRNEILMCACPPLFAGEEFSVCLQVIFDLFGMTLIGVSQPNGGAHLGQLTEVIPEQSYLYFIGNRTQFHLFKVIESESSALIEEQMKTVKNARSFSKKESTLFSAYDTVSKTVEFSKDVNIQDFGDLQDHIVICCFDDSSIVDVVMLLERIYLYAYGDPLFGFPENEPPITVVVHPTITEEKAESLQKRFPRTYFMRESPERLITLEKASVFRARNVLVLGDSSFSFQGGSNGDQIFSGINTESLDRKAVMTLLNLELLLGADNHTHICIEVKMSHSIAFLGLPKPRRRYSFFGIPNERHFVDQQTVKNTSIETEKKTFQTNWTGGTRKNANNISSAIVNFGPRYIKSLVPRSSEDEFDLGASSATTWFRERYASGEVLLDSLPGVLLAREYEHHGAFSLIGEIIGLRGGDRLTSLTSPRLRLVGIPSKWVGWNYYQVFHEVLALGLIPIGLYRSGEAPVRSNLVPSLPKNFLQEVSSDIFKLQRRFGHPSVGTVLNEEEGYYPAQNLLPWIYTNPAQDTIVGYRDGLYVIVQTPIDSRVFRSIYEGTDYGQGSPWNWFLHSGFWKLLFEYFPLTVYQRVDYDSPPSKTLLVSCQPHGVMAVSRKLLYGYIWETLSFKQEGQLIMRRALAARPLFYIPLCRELTLWSGGIDASRDSALYSFQTGKSILVFPGGNREIFLTRKDEICTHIQKRKGFIKLALETGSSIVPVLAIGEEELFELFRMVPETIQERFLHNFRLPVGIAIGHFGTCMPKKVPLKIIVGKPISIARKTHPCIEQIDRTHAMYMERLRQLYEEFQLVFGMGGFEMGKDTFFSLIYRHRLGLACLLFCLDLLVSIFVIVRVPYTEIDFKTYLQQVYQVFFEGKRDYQTIGGDTGPLVYPAGFLVFYRLLYAISCGGKELLPAQIVFALIHASTLFIVLLIYICCDLNGHDLLFCALPLVFSRRVLSIHVLRLFNDAIVSFLSYLSILLFLLQQHFLGCIVYSLSVSVKMSALLYAPGVFIILLESGPLIQVVWYILVCALVQLGIGAPFLLEYPMSYILKAFEFHRVFLYQWTVNWKFLPEKVFVSPYWSICLLLAHIIVLLVWWRRIVRMLINKIHHFQKASSVFSKTESQDKPNHEKFWRRLVVTILFHCQFIGIAFGRSIHYQFYAWYFHSLPWILRSLGINSYIR